MATILPTNEPKLSDYPNERAYAQAWAAWANLREAERLKNGGNNSANDDNAQAGKNNTSATTLDGKGGSETIVPTRLSGQKSGTSLIDARFPGVRKQNPLGNYSSSTYSISLYMVTPEYLNEYISGTTSGTNPGQLPTNNDGIYVVAQSAGINNSFDKRALTNRRKLGSGEKGLDYYIEDLEVNFQIAPSSTTLSTIASDITFKIVEPIGFSFLHDLAMAAARINGLSDIIKGQKAKESAPNSIQQLFIIGIRFYGYDVNGKIVNPGSSNSNNSISQFKTDSNSITERFIPCMIEQINWKLDDKATIYSVTARATYDQLAFSENTNSLKRPVNVTGVTVGETLSALTQQLTDISQEFVKNGAIESGNEYYIEWVGGDSNPIAKSLLVDDATVEKNLTAMYSASSTYKVNVGGTAKSVTYDPTTRQLQFQAGVSVTEIIDNIIVKSDYITSALNQVNNGNTETETSDNADLKELNWYYINPVVKMLGWNEKQKYWGLRITYQIGVYKIPYIKTPYKNSSPKYPGPYKVYNYIYTGENSEIIEYDQSYNNLYGVYVTDVAGISIENLSTAEIIKKTGSAPIFSVSATNSNSTGGKSNSGSGINENVRAQLYSPNDQSKASLKIMGDPDWIMSVIGLDQKIGTTQENSNTSKYNINFTTNSSAIARQLYGPDYSINPFYGQAYIQIIFNIATDYQDDGLLDVGDDILFYKTDIFDPQQAGIQGLVYTVTHVVSMFSRGSFTQTLTLVYVTDEELLNGPSQSKSESDGTRESSDSNGTRQPIDTSSKEFIESRDKIDNAINNADWDATGENVNPLEAYANDDRASFAPIRPPKNQAEAREIYGNRSANTYGTTTGGAATGGFRNPRRPR